MLSCNIIPRSLKKDQFNDVILWYCCQSYSNMATQLKLCFYPGAIATWGLYFQTHSNHRKLNRSTEALHEWLRCKNWASLLSVARHGLRVTWLKFHVTDDTIGLAENEVWTLSKYVYHIFPPTTLQPVTVAFQSRLWTGRWLEKTMVTETLWFTSAAPDSGSLAPQYKSVSKTTAGPDISQCVSVSTLTWLLAAKSVRCY